MAQVGIVSNPRPSLNGISVDGMLEEAEMPSYELLMSEAAGQGMAGTLELFTGRIGAMEMKLKFLFFPDLPVVFQLLNNPRIATRLVLRAEQYIYRGSDEPTIGDFEGTFLLRPKEPELGTFEAEEGAKPECTFAVDRFTIKINGAEKIHIDPLSSEGIRINGKKLNFSAPT